MAQSKLALYNMALSACGADYTLAAVDEESIPAAVCNLWYENVRQTVFRAAHWNVGKRHVRLAKLSAREVTTGYTNAVAGEEWVDTDPEPGFAFSYSLPEDMMAARFLTTYEQFDIGYASDQRILSANTGGPAATDTPILCYTVDVDDPDIWDPSLYQAMAYGLAGHICQPLHGKPQRAIQSINLANAIMLEAQTQSANEMHQKLIANPERLQVRGYSNSAISPYVYPYGSLFSGTGASVV